MRYRVRDIVVVSTSTSFPGNITLKGTLASRPAAGNPGQLYYITDATQQRWQRDNGSVWEEVPQLNTNGVMTFGSGDVDIYRQGVDILATDDDLQIRRGQVGMISFGGTSNSTISFGSASDSTIYRVGAQILETNSQIHSLRAAGTNSSFASKVTGDSNDRFDVRADGLHSWGPGNGVTDTNLYRSAANTLKTDNNLIVAGTTTLTGTATAPTPATADNSTKVATTAYVQANFVASTVYIPVPSGIVAGETAVYNGSNFARSTVTKLGNTSLAGYPWVNADIASGAAIVSTKLAGYPWNNADIASGAGIAISKLSIGGTPNGTKFLRDDASWQTVSTSYALLQDQKTQNTAGGTATSGSWQTRTLNTEVADANGIVTLAANQFTLQSGTYRLRARVPGYQVNRFQARLQNISDTTTTAFGSSQFAVNTGGPQEDSVINSEFTISGSKIFEIQMRVQATTATNGWGVEANFGTEIYTTVEIWKIS